MFRSTVINIVALLILSGCAGGFSGIVNSSYPGHWLVYKVSYPEDEKNFDQPAEEILENQLFNQGFKKYMIGEGLGLAMLKLLHSNKSTEAII